MLLQLALVSKYIFRYILKMSRTGGLADGRTDGQGNYYETNMPHFSGHKKTRNASNELQFTGVN